MAWSRAHHLRHHTRSAQTMSEMEKNDITPSLRPEANRTNSDLEKATATHVERTGPGVSALEDETLMSGERQEKVCLGVCTAPSGIPLER